MPRSSGGGSHSSSSSSRSSGGGSHRSSYSGSSSSYSSSSYSSSSRSYSSSSSSYSSSKSSYSSGRSGSYSSSSYGSSYSRPTYTPPKPRISQKPFKGAETYVYYRNKEPHYIYTNYHEPKRELHIGRLLFYIFLFAIFVMALIDLSTPPAKLPADANSGVVIDDAVNCLGDTTELNRSLNAFMDKTGISPAIITVYNEYWVEYYDDLDDLAYDLYVNSFEDEKHWLLVYSFPESEDAEFDDWYWMGMMGDDTAGILTDEVLDGFYEQLQRNLLARNRMSITEAFTDAFDKLTPGLMEYRPLGAVDYIVDLSLILGIAYLGLRRSGIIRKGKRQLPDGIPKDAKKCSAPPVADKVLKTAEEVMLCCEYCSSLYASDRSSCPNCGAPRSEKTKVHH